MCHDPALGPRRIGGLAAGFPVTLNAFAGSEIQALSDLRLQCGYAAMLASACVARSGFELPAFVVVLLCLACLRSGQLAGRVIVFAPLRLAPGPTQRLDFTGTTNFTGQVGLPPSFVWHVAVMCTMRGVLRPVLPSLLGSELLPMLHPSSLKRACGCVWYRVAGRHRFRRQCHVSTVHQPTQVLRDRSVAVRFSVALSTAAVVVRGLLLRI